MNGVLPDLERATQAARQALFAAHLDPDGEIEPVVPLREIIKYHELQVDELPHLTRRSAETFLREACGLAIPSTRQPEPELAGFLYANRSGGWILINCNANNPLTRRRFSIAHELGHYLLHFLPLLETSTVSTDEDEIAAEFLEGLTTPVDDEATDVGRSQGIATPSRYQEPLRLTPAEIEAMEVEADYFAAELLMPESTIRRLATLYYRLCGRSREVLARRLATECLVSRAAMVRRLTYLALP